MHTSKHARSFVILGEAGVGKTHLLSYFLSHGDVSSYEIITTSCFKSKQDEYLYPWQTIMLSLSNFIEKESIPIPNAYMQAVSALFPMLGEFGSADVRKKAHLLVDSVMGFDSVLTVLTLASKKKPLLLVVEDIQWIDSMSLALLDQALHKIGPEKFVFAATCRQPCGKEVERFLRNVEEDELCSLLSLAAFTYEETMQFIELCGARGIVLQDKDRIYHERKGMRFCSHNSSVASWKMVNLKFCHTVWMRFYPIGYLALVLRDAKYSILLLCSLTMLHTGFLKLLAVSQRSICSMSARNCAVVLFLMKSMMEEVSPWSLHRRNFGILLIHIFQRFRAESCT